MVMRFFFQIVLSPARIHPRKGDTTAEKSRKKKKKREKFNVLKFSQQSSNRSLGLVSLQKELSSLKDCSYASP